MATGVAKPKAHGQAITTTVIAKLNDSSKLLLNIIFRMKVRREMQRIKGTNIALTLSASREIGALDELASSTSLIIVAKEESSPTLDALTFIYPDVTIVEAKTSSPSFFNTGSDSPVILL